MSLPAEPVGAENPVQAIDLDILAQDDEKPSPEVPGDRRPCKMPAHKVGRLWKFQASEFDFWVRGGGAAANQDVGGQDTSGGS